MQVDLNSDDNQEVRPGEHFEGSRPGKGTALFVVGVMLAIALYNFWPQIESALDVG